MKDLEKLLFSYEAGVQDPEVSGMEHLDMLLTRSALEKASTHLNDLQKTRLAKADTMLSTCAAQFYASIARIANLRSWREQEHAPPEQWWWYLDVLAAAPLPSMRLPELVAA